MIEQWRDTFGSSAAGRFCHRASLTLVAARLPVFVATSDPALQRGGDEPLQRVLQRGTVDCGAVRAGPHLYPGLCWFIAVWAVTGPNFGYSDTWQLIINTGTTIVTFLMVFLIQNTQNRDAAAMQAEAR